MVLIVLLRGVVINCVVRWMGRKGKARQGKARQARQGKAGLSRVFTTLVRTVTHPTTLSGT